MLFLKEKKIGIRFSQVRLYLGGGLYTHKNIDEIKYIIFLLVTPEIMDKFPISQVNIKVSISWAGRVV